MTKLETSERLVHVPLGERSYDILIGPGLMARAGGEITSRIKGRRAAIVTDENVGSRYLDGLMDSLQTDGIEAVDGSDEGIDTLTNIQSIQYVRPDGSIESTVQIDDYGNAPDAGPTQRLCCRNQDGKKSGRRAEVGSRDE